MPYQFTNEDRSKGGSTSKRGAGTYTTKLREMVHQLISDNHENIIEDIKELPPDKRVDAWIKLLEYGLPKLQRVEGKLDISNLSNDEVEALVEKIIASDG